jgi:hypothetical protein
MTVINYVEVQKVLDNHDNKELQERAIFVDRYYLISRLTIKQ